MSLLDDDKVSLCDQDDVPYMVFRAGLQPLYVRVWLDVAIGYLALAGALAAAVLLQRVAAWLCPLTVLTAAVWCGYFIAYLQLFVHEAAHFNIAPGRRLNDILSNLFLGSWVGLNIGTYREIHWGHHRLLGETGDTEHSYFEPLDLRYIIGSFTGLRVLRVLISRRKTLHVAHTSKPLRARLDLLVLSFGLLLNASLIGLLLSTGAWQAALAWLLGMTVFFPFFGSIRQLLEHRSEQADPDVDYSQTAHGACARIFRSGPIGSTLGAAGFDRHLLHHWDPQISYTRLPAVEQFLLRSDYRDEILQATTTYGQTFRQLFGKRPKPVEPADSASLKSIASASSLDVVQHHRGSCDEQETESLNHS